LRMMSWIDLITVERLMPVSSPPYYA